LDYRNDEKVTVTKQAQCIYEFGLFRVDAAKRVLLRDGEVVQVTPKCFEILLALVESSGEVLSKDVLMKQVWPDSFVEEGNLTYNISMLRKALSEKVSEHQYIVTIPGRGYRFSASVREVRDKAMAQPADRVSEGALKPDAQTSEKKRTAAPGSFSVTQRAALVFLLITLAGIGIYLLLGRAKAIDSIAVLPFTDVGADPNTEYLSDGITETLINSLSQLPNLTVMSRNSVLRYKGQEVDAQVVGRDLKVQAVLTGRIVQRGDSLTVSAELVNVHDNRHLWGAQYDRKLADIQAVRELSEKLRLHLSGAQQKQLTKSYTDDAEAYRLFLRGLFFWNKRTPEAIEKAGEYFQQAVDKDPSFALAYVGLADSYHVPADAIALVYAGLGEKDPAFTWLEKAHEQRLFRMSWLKVEPRWDTIRGDPRFASLLRRMGITP
jgi:DNA-binding winged helix-turn-helix (wHTH) protein/TolB-like protein